MTGNVPVPLPIRECQDEIDAVHTAYIADEPAEQQPVSVSTEGYYGTSDSEYLQRGLERDAKFRSLWNGDRPKGDESGDDMGLLDKLAYWCNKNAQLMEEAFRSSGHYASKDEEHMKKCTDRKDYVPRTISEAIAGTKSTARQDDERWKKANRPTPSEDFGEAAPESITKLNTISGAELMARDLGAVEFLVKDFLHQGLAALSADPKVGKSWFALDLCLSVASGTEFLGYTTKKSGALYLALEDSLRRFKGRMLKVMQSKGIDRPDNLYLAISAPSID